MKSQGMMDERGFGLVAEQCAYGICLDVHQRRVTPPCDECMTMAREFVEAALTTPGEQRRMRFTRIRNAWLNRCLLCLFAPFHGQSKGNDLANLGGEGVASVVPAEAKDSSFGADAPSSPQDGAG